VPGHDPQVRVVNGGHGGVGIQVRVESYALLLPKDDATVSFARIRP